MVLRFECIWDRYCKSFLHTSKPMSNFYYFLFQVSTTVILLWNYASQVINCVKVQRYNLWSLSNNSDPEYCKFKGIDRHWKVPTSLHLQKLLIRCNYSSDWESRTIFKLTKDGVVTRAWLIGNIFWVFPYLWLGCFLYISLS